MLCFFRQNNAPTEYSWRPQVRSILHFRYVLYVKLSSVCNRFSMICASISFVVNHLMQSAPALNGMKNRIHAPTYTHIPNHCSGKMRAALRLRVGVLQYSEPYECNCVNGWCKCVGVWCMPENCHQHCCRSLIGVVSLYLCLCSDSAVIVAFKACNTNLFKSHTCDDVKYVNVLLNILMISHVQILVGFFVEVKKHINIKVNKLIWTADLRRSRTKTIFVLLRTITVLPVIIAINRYSLPQLQCKHSLPCVNL